MVPAIFSVTPATYRKRGNDFTELSRAVQQAGLLRRGSRLRRTSASRTTSATAMRAAVFLWPHAPPLARGMGCPRSGRNQVLFRDDCRRVQPRMRLRWQHNNEDRPTTRQGEEIAVEITFIFPCGQRVKPVQTQGGSR